MGVGVREHVIRHVSFWGFRACVDSLARGGVEKDEVVCRGVEKEGEVDRWGCTTWFADSPGWMSVCLPTCGVSVSLFILACTYE